MLVFEFSIWVSLLGACGTCWCAGFFSSGICYENAYIFFLHRSVRPRCCAWWFELRMSQYPVWLLVSWAFKIIIDVTIDKYLDAMLSPVLTNTHLSFLNSKSPRGKDAILRYRAANMLFVTLSCHVTFPLPTRESWMCSETYRLPAFASLDLTLFYISSPTTPGAEPSCFVSQCALWCLHFYLFLVRLGFYGVFISALAGWLGMNLTDSMSSIVILSWSCFDLTFCCSIIWDLFTLWHRSSFHWIYVLLTWTNPRTDALPIAYVCNWQMLL